MIDPDSLLTISLIVLLVLDLITSATRSGYLNSSLARMIKLKEDRETQVTRYQNLLNNLPKAQGQSKPQSNDFTVSHRWDCCTASCPLGYISLPCRNCSIDPGAYRFGHIFFGMVCGVGCL